MTREKAKELLPIITAWANGEAIQIKTGSVWAEPHSPQFDCDPSDYRIKPKPRKPLECWVFVSTEGNMEEKLMTITPPSNPAYRLFREVIEGVEP